MSDKPLHPLSIYGSHDASICIKPLPNHYRVYEFERLLKKRNCRLNIEPDFKQHLITVRDLIKAEYGIEDYGSCFYGQLNNDQLDILKEVFGFNHFEEISHHLGHAACGLHQSPYDECLVVSSDSGGHEMEGWIATFCIYHANKITGIIKKIADIPLDVCSPYTLLAIPVKEINKTDVWTKFLTYAGKIMGLVAYGNVRKEWIEPIKAFYYQSANEESLKQLGVKIGFDFSDINTIKEQNSYDLATTSQYVFEELTLNAIKPFVERYKIPVVLTGGGALNVLMNQSFRNIINNPVFVPVNPNDCGLSFGFMALRNPPSQTVNISYNGFGILDINELPDYVQKYNAQETDLKELARLICKVKIIGVIRGNIEVGARALGNRSIICDPSISKMKDKINKIKNREWFRPFAPVVKEEDVNKYFHFDGDSKYMTYAPIVQQKYIKKIPSVVHHDHTARIQTVTKDQNEFLYNLIDYVETINGTGVLLNTSFNIKGNPILTTIKDALEVLETTQLDYVYCEGYLFEKKK